MEMRIMQAKEAIGAPCPRRDPPGYQLEVGEDTQMVVVGLRKPHVVVGFGKGVYLQQRL